MCPLFMRGGEMNDFPPDLSWELQDLSNKIKKPIFASYCPCGTVHIQTEKFTKEDDKFCPKCSPRPLGFLSKIICIVIGIVVALIVINN